MANLMLMNPRRKARRRTTRRRTTRKRRATRRRRNPVAANPRRRRRRTTRRRSYRRRNPRTMFGGLGRELMPALTGAGGALGLDVAFATLPLPAMMKTGPMGLISKIGGAIALGMLARNFTTKKTADQITAGALTVIAYGATKSFLQTSMPQLPLSEYLNGSFDYNAMGYTNAAMTVPGVEDFGYNAIGTQPMTADPDAMGEYLNDYNAGYAGW